MAADTGDIGKTRAASSALDGIGERAGGAIGEGSLGRGNSGHGDNGGELHFDGVGGLLQRGFCKGSSFWYVYSNEEY